MFFHKSERNVDIMLLRFVMTTIVIYFLKFADLEECMYNISLLNYYFFDTQYLYKSFDSTYTRCLPSCVMRMCLPFCVIEDPQQNTVIWIPNRKSFFDTIYLFLSKSVTFPSYIINLKYINFVFNVS